MSPVSTCGVDRPLRHSESIEHIKHIARVGITHLREIFETALPLDKRIEKSQSQR